MWRLLNTNILYLGCGPVFIFGYGGCKNLGYQQGADLCNTKMHNIKVTTPSVTHTSSQSRVTSAAVAPVISIKLELVPNAAPTQKHTQVFNTVKHQAWKDRVAMSVTNITVPTMAMTTGENKRGSIDIQLLKT